MQSRFAPAGLSLQALIGSGLLDAIGSTIAKRFRPTRCVIISDENVARLFSERVTESLRREKFEPDLIVVPPGEKSKSLTQAGAICEQMIAAGLDRQSFVVALGGGVVGDLAGFVAAVFHRGIPYVQVPTTLLAQVDSSIGGKTAVNTASGKNLIGAFHHPALVISDVDVLKTLPPREFNQGVAEIVKHAIIADAAMLEEVAQVSNLRTKETASWKLAPLIQRNIAIKAEFIADDERDEKGKRALLNFGHTVGHAIEQAGNYEQFLHGEAISLGMVAACHVSVRKAGLSEAQRAKIIAALEAFDLPTRLPADFPREKILEAIRFDKKFQSGRKCALSSRPRLVPRVSRPT